MSFLDNFRYRITGDAHEKKLVLLHGLMGSAANWAGIVPHFEQTHQVLTFDQRGHGRSFKPEAGYQSEDFADDLEKILEILGWDRIYLVGHSMGGRSALNFGYRLPERVVKLVIEDIGPSVSSRSIEKIEHLLSLVPTPFASRIAARRFFLEGEFEQTLAGDPYAKVLGGYFYSNIAETPAGAADWRFSKAAVLKALRVGLGTDRLHEVQELEVPTLLVRGEHSEDLSRAEYEQLLLESPHLTGVEIAGAGHWVHFDQPARFIEAIRTFFDDTSH